MKISVIVPTYRRPRYLERCLRALATQVRAPDEIIVVTRKEDDAAHKVVRRFIEECKKHSILVKNVNVHRPGVVPAVNQGLQYVFEGVVCIIDDDSTAAEDWLQQIEGYYRKSTVGGVGGPIIPCVDNKPTIKKRRIIGRVSWFGFVFNGLTEITETPRYVDHLAGSNISFRRDLLNKFDESLLGYYFRFEMDACLHIVKKKRCKIIYDPNIRIYHHSKRSKIKPTNCQRYDEIYSINSNNTYVLLKYFSFLQKIIFLLFTFIIGDAPSNGFFTLMIRVIKYKEPKILKEILPAFRGKFNGILSYMSRKKVFN